MNWWKKKNAWSQNFCLTRWLMIFPLALDLLDWKNPSFLVLLWDRKKKCFLPIIVPDRDWNWSLEKKWKNKIRELAWNKFPLPVWTATIESFPLPRLCLIQAFNRLTYNPSHKGKDLITRTRNKEGRRKATPTGKGSLDVSKAEAKANRTYRRKMGEEILLGLEERLLNFYGRMLKCPRERD